MLVAESFQAKAATRRRGLFASQHHDISSRSLPQLHRKPPKKKHYLQRQKGATPVFNLPFALT